MPAMMISTVAWEREGEPGKDRPLSRGPAVPLTLPGLAGVVGDSEQELVCVIQGRGDRVTVPLPLFAGVDDRLKECEREMEAVREEEDVSDGEAEGEGAADALGLCVGDGENVATLTMRNLSNTVPVWVKNVPVRLLPTMSSTNAPGTRAPCSPVASLTLAGCLKPKVVPLQICPAEPVTTDTMPLWGTMPSGFW